MKNIKLLFKEFAEINPAIFIEKHELLDFIPMEEITPGKKYIKPNQKKSFKGGGAKFRNQDVLFARITPCLENGKIAMVRGLECDKGFGSTEFLVFRAKKEICDPHFLYYLVRSHDFHQNAINSMVGASGRQRVEKKAIASFHLDMPDLSLQKRIASILSAYDDLIDVNLQRIKLLEEASELIYKEWFVNFRFPGHESVRFVDGIPEGWKRTSIGDYCPLLYGKALKNGSEVGNSYPVYGSSGIIRQTEMPLVKGPGIIIGRKGNVGKVFWSREDFYPIDTVYYVEPRKVSPFVHSLFKNIHFNNSDSAVPGLNRNYAHSITVLLPSKHILNEFNQIVEPILHAIELMGNHNIIIGQTRDLLLPKLMSGEIEV